MIVNLEISECNNTFGVYAVISTTETAEWSVNNKPLIQIVNSEKDMEMCGIDLAEYPIKNMKVGEKMNINHDFNGVYVMRLG